MRQSLKEKSASDFLFHMSKAPGRKSLISLYRFLPKKKAASICHEQEEKGCRNVIKCTGQLIS